MQAYRLVRRAGGSARGDDTVADVGVGAAVGDGGASRGAVLSTDGAGLRVDAVQAEVVGHTDGPMLVLGGPGTGKTSTLVEAVAARVAEGVDPERILVLTFGRRGATALRQRIEARVTQDGHRVLREPLVRTFPRTPSGCSAEPPPNEASLRPGCSPAPSRI